MVGVKTVDLQVKLPINLSINRAKSRFIPQEDTEIISNERRIILINLGYSDVILSRAMQILERRPNDVNALLDIIKYNNFFMSHGRFIYYCEKINQLNIVSDEATKSLLDHYYKSKDWENIVNLANRVREETQLDLKNIKKIITALKKTGKIEGILEFTSNLGGYSKIHSDILKEMAIAYSILGRYYHSAKLWNKIKQGELSKVDLMRTIKSNYNAKNYVKAVLISNAFEQRYGGSFENSFIKIRAEYMAQNWESCIETCILTLLKYSKKKSEIKKYQSKSVLNLYKNTEKWHKLIRIGE